MLPVFTLLLYSDDSNTITTTEKCMEILKHWLFPWLFCSIKSTFQKKFSKFAPLAEECLQTESSASGQFTVSYSPTSTHYKISVSMHCFNPFIHAFH